MVAATIQIKGQRFVIVPEDEYDRLLNRSRHKSSSGRSENESDLPPLPKALPNGNYDAIAYARASLARKLIRDRRSARLSQAELARRAGIRVETLNRIERLKMTPTVATVQKIDRALADLEKSDAAKTRKVKALPR
jgi:ribosome-binding protein aMBF1 (putative translation factor)